MFQPYFWPPQGRIQLYDRPVTTKMKSRILQSIIQIKRAGVADLCLGGLN